MLNWLIYLLIEELRTEETTHRVTFLFVIPSRNS